jgi:hypothetical protein
VGGLTVGEWMVCVLRRIPNPGLLRPALAAIGLMAESEDRCLDAVLQACPSKTVNSWL